MNLNGKDLIKYFDKKTPEEDSLVEIDDELQLCYSNLDKIYEGFFEENFLSTAKVI